MPPETEQERQLKEEQDIMRQVTQKQALKTYKELAKVGPLSFCSKLD